MSYEDNNPFASDEARPAFLAPSSLDVPAVNQIEWQFKPSVAATTTLPSSEMASHDVPGYHEQILRAGESYAGRCHRVDQVSQYLEAGGLIHILDAGKNNEGSGSSFITYIIRTGDLEVRRRYSEFESLRNCFTRLYPCCIVPPIPEKHSMSDYAVAPTKAKEDPNMIEHRKRMLEAFLRRISRHTILRYETILHKFLDSNVSWSEVVASPPISHLPKNILKGPPCDPASAYGDLAYSNLPVPTHTSKSSRIVTGSTSERLLKVENTSKEFEAILASTLEKTNRRILKRFGDLSVDYNELGANYNAFSLSEAPLIAGSIERLGQASDGTYLSTQNLVANLSFAFSEPLGEQTQFLGIIRQVLKYRRQKITQVEQASELLEQKKSSLESWLRSEQEAKRIDGALIEIDAPLAVSNVQEEGVLATEFPPTHDSQSSGSTGNQSVATPPEESKKRNSIGFKFGFGKLNHAIHSFTDTDPALSRRNKIGATKELITSLETASRNSKRDLDYIDRTLSREGEDWEEKRRDDWRNLIGAVGDNYVEYARKCLEVWEDAAKEIQAIPAAAFF